MRRVQRSEGAATERAFTCTVIVQGAYDLPRAQFELSPDNIRHLAVFNSQQSLLKPMAAGL
jgi:hypothetical protein